MHLCRWCKITYKWSYLWGTDKRELFCHSSYDSTGRINSLSWGSRQERKRVRPVRGAKKHSFYVYTILYVFDCELASQSMANSLQSRPQQCTLIQWQHVCTSELHHCKSLLIIAKPTLFCQRRCPTPSGGPLPLTSNWKQKFLYCIDYSRRNGSPVGNWKQKSTERTRNFQFSVHQKACNHRTQFRMNPKDVQHSRHACCLATWTKKMLYTLYLLHSQCFISTAVQALIKAWWPVLNRTAIMQLLTTNGALLLPVHTTQPLQP